MADVIKFPENGKKKPVSAKDITTVGFLTIDDRDLWIQDAGDIAKLISFIVREKITIYEDK